MERIYIIVERSDNGYYFAINDKCHNITAKGESIEAMKKDLLMCIESINQLSYERPKFLDRPYQLVYCYSEATVNYFSNQFDIRKPFSIKAIGLYY